VIECGGGGGSYVVAIDEGFPRVFFGVQSSGRGIMFVSHTWI
jgi:hypothetical protein